MDAEATFQKIAPSGLMKPEDAAEYLQISANTLCVWRSTNRKRIPYVKIGGHVRYRRQDLDAFITDNLRNAEAA